MLYFDGHVKSSTPYDFVGDMRSVDSKFKVLGSMWAADYTTQISVAVD